MVMDYAGGGEVLEFVMNNGALQEDEARKIIIQIINAINYCHSRGIVHRDLKLENVLFRDKITEEDRDLFVKIIDFGIAGVCETGKADKIDAGSIHYMPPECFEGHAVASDPSLDVWAIGLMFYSLLYGTLPFFSEDEAELIKRIKTDKLKFDKTVPVTLEARNIIAMMLERDIEKRLDLADFVEMDYYKYEDHEFKE
jgi:serine/threonine protein kinase